MSFFSKDSVFVSNKTTQFELFKEISSFLLKLGLVANNFFEHLTERELKYPTGLKLTPINDKFPNIALPHTESEFVKTSRIVPVKLNNPIIFHNMINPEEQFYVEFLFFILNKSANQQSELLANIMDFINITDAHDLLTFFNLKNADQIYTFLTNNFKGDN